MPLEIEDDILTVDRSTLEAYATCPAMARLIETGTGALVGRAAVVGNEVHEAVSQTVRLYVDSGGSADRPTLRDDLETNLRQSRPDVQPEVIDSFRASVWAFSDWLWRQNAGNILRFDGGDGAQSGQMSADIESAGQVVRVTTEVDILMATASSEVISETDYKSGWAKWGPEDVAASFQFGLHAMLVFANYPKCEVLRTSVWRTRTGKLSPAVEFYRGRMEEIETRVRSAVGDFIRWRGVDPARCQARPCQENCRICPAAVRCPVVDEDLAELANDPASWVDRLAAFDRAGDIIKERLGAIVDKTGADVVGRDMAFGFDKPKGSRKPPKSLYAVRGDE